MDLLNRSEKIFKVCAYLLVIAFAAVTLYPIVYAFSVSISGMIGWVGLVIPHICRLLVGQNTRLLLPCSMLLGASFLMLVDDLARCLTTSEIPLGILTALVGAPLFLYLIVKGGARDAA
jgi:iron complex transport system permease protein